MSTRSAIGYQMPSGRIKAVYCHWDGEPRIKEKELKRYTDKRSVMNLINKGNMSQLETASTWASSGINYKENAREPQPLYHSERGDRWAQCKPRVSISKREAIRFWSGWDCEYLYVYTPGGWKTFKIHD
tara:strand:- start:179 stop:565 length:387 start_codon:yes stop_codon:yes gene_type:complete